MCSILALLDRHPLPADAREKAIARSRLQRHRGPDDAGVHQTDRAILVHERLAVVDPAGGRQPLLSPDGHLSVAVNGEIYNHRTLRAELGDRYPFRTASDAEVVLALYATGGPDALRRLEGIFALVLHDGRDRGSRWVVARDPMGVVPLYTGRDARGTLHVASEMKALLPECRSVEVFPPGHLLDSAEGTIRRYVEPSWERYEDVLAAPSDPGAVGPALARAVERQLMADVPVGVLISGGLDSSLVAALAVRAARESGLPPLPSFSVGLEGSPDLAMARQVARHLGTRHHEVVFTPREGIDALRDVIWHLETYDVTTIRAATPMLLMARAVRREGVRVVLSGEGADEIFGGYLYFHHAPDARSLHEETVRKLDRLHLYDCLRANKAMAAWGVEARVPFLDTTFLDVAMTVDPAAKMVGPDGLEKRLLREAAAGLLPDAVRLRQKEQFSDGVGYGWIDALRSHAGDAVSPSELAGAAGRYPLNPPRTAEGFLYRRIFQELFPGQAAAATVPGGDSVACSTPEALAWIPGGGTADPSGRAVAGVHRAAW